MDSTSTLSPPTSCARDARSVVAVMMRILLSALPTTGQSKAKTSAKDEVIGVKRVFVNKRGIEISWNGLERMSAVRAHHKKELEKNFIGIRKISGTGRQMSEAVLTTDLAELARPIRQDTGKAGIRQTGVGGVATAVEASADGPAAIHAVFRGGVHAKSMLRLEKIRDCGRELVTRAPEQLGTEQEGFVDSAAERLPAERRVSAIQIGEKSRRIEGRADASIVVTAGIGDAEIEVGGFGQIAIGAEVADDADVLPAAGLEHVRGITAQYFGAAFEEPVLRRRQEAREEEAGVVDAVLPADQIIGDERPVNERQGVIVNGVDLAKVSARLADLQQQASGERREGDVSLFNVHTRFAERQEGIGARVGIDDGLKTYFRFMHFERPAWRDVIVARRADEIADQADVRVEELGVAGRASENLCLRSLCGGRGRCGGHHAGPGMCGG